MSLLHAGVNITTGGAVINLMNVIAVRQWHPEGHTLD